MEGLPMKILIIGLNLTGTYLILYYLISQEWFINFLGTIGKSIKKIVEDIRGSFVRFLKKYLVRENTSIRKFYEKFLMFVNISVEKFFSIKIWLAIIALVLTILVKNTDISVETMKLYTKFEYEQDMISRHIGEFTEEEKEELLELKKVYLDKSLKEINRSFFYSVDKNMMEDYIIMIIEGIGNDTEIETESYASEVYHKLKTYYNIREVDYKSYLLITLLLFFVPDIMVFIYNFFIKVDSKNELSFMKRLIIMNGSIKPVDFIEVLKELIDKSKYYKKTLNEIQDKNKRNYLPNTQIYLHYIKNSKNLSEKLFFEKLDEANNYDFDQAIINIKNEFKLDKRMQARKIKKTVEVIHILGIVGFMLLIVLVVMYLILPWMTAYKMDSVM